MTAIPARLRAVASARGLAAMRHRNYRLYWIGQLISLVGTHMQRAAQAWLVLTLTNDPLMLGLLVTAQFGPVLAFGLFGGIVADSLPKRRTIVFTQAIAMALAFALAVLTATGTTQVWHVLLLALLLGLTSVVDLPTRQSFVMEMVGRDDVVSAVALNSALVHAAKVVGPAVAGLTIAALGTAIAFFINGLTFVAVIVGLLAMRSEELNLVRQSPLPRSFTSVFANLGEGLRYVRHAPHVLLALTIVGLVSTAGMNFQVLIPPLARDVLLAGPSGFGFLMAAAGLGSITAAVLFAFRGRPGLPSMLLAGLMLGVFEIALGASHWIPLSLVCMFAVGLSGVAMTTNANVLIQVAVPDHLRGRVIALYVTVFAGTTPVGGLIFGAIAGVMSASEALVIGGLVSVAVAALVGLAASRSGVLEPPQPVAMEATVGTVDNADDLLA